MANTIAQDKKESAQEDASREDQLLDQLLDQYMAPPQGLSQRILARCHEAAEEDAFLREEDAIVVRRARFGFWRAASLAACLCLGCYLGVVWTTNRSQDNASPALQLAKALAVAPAIPESAPETPFAGIENTASAPAVAAAATIPTDDTVALKAAPRRAPAEAVVPSGELATADPRGFSFRDEQSLRKQAAFRTPSQEVRTVSTQGGETVNSSRRKRLAPMESEVTQVWIAPEMLSQEKLQAFLEKHPATTAGNASPDENGVLTFTILAMDTEIQQLVDTLFSQLHWKLLSPNSPQPGEFYNTPIAGEPVKYTIKLVQGK